MQKDELAKKK